EGEEENRGGVDPLVEEVGDAVGEGAGLAAAGPGDDEGRTRRRGHGSELLFIEFRRVIDPRLRVFPGLSNSIFTRHLRRSVVREHRFCANKTPKSRPSYIFLAAASAN